MRERMIGGGLVAVALVALIGCSSTTGGSSAPASSAPGSAAASAAAPSEAAPSEAAASEAVPGFSFPSSDKELEALIPDELCGVKVTKISAKGEEAIGADNTEMLGVLQGLGKSVSDVGVAMGMDMTGGSTCSVFIFRIAGADEGKLRDLFKQEAQKEGMTYTELSLGGKNVARTDATKFTYAWGKGDGLIVVSADTEANAADIISQLP